MKANSSFRARRSRSAFPPLPSPRSSRVPDAPGIRGVSRRRRRRVGRQEQTIHGAGQWLISAQLTRFGQYFLHSFFTDYWEETANCWFGSLDIKNPSVEKWGKIIPLMGLMVLCCRRSDGRNGINPLVGHSTGRVWDFYSGQNFS